MYGLLAHLLPSSAYRLTICVLTCSCSALPRPAASSPRGCTASAPHKRCNPAVPQLHPHTPHAARRARHAPCARPLHAPARTSHAGVRSAGRDGTALGKVHRQRVGCASHARLGARWRVSSRSRAAAGGWRGRGCGGGSQDSKRLKNLPPHRRCRCIKVYLYVNGQTSCRLLIKVCILAFRGSEIRKTMFIAC